MDSSRKDWSKQHGNDDSQGRSSYPRAGHNSGWGSSEHEPYRYGGSGNDRGEPFYDTSSREYNDYRSGYSTANDFSEQRSPFERSRRSGRDQRSFGQEDFQQRRQSSEYPETYRSAMGGYMSEHVGSDAGRKDYNQDTNRGNLYGNRYSRYQGNYDRGYMSEDDYDRGSPAYRSGTNDRSNFDQSDEQGQYRGKGPRNYKRGDHRILEDINERLTDDPFIDASEIEVAVKDGEVTLSGSVENRKAKRRAEDIAESVSGARHVENKIKVGSGMRSEGMRSEESDEHTPLPVTPY